MVQSREEVRKNDEKLIGPGLGWVEIAVTEAAWPLYGILTFSSDPPDALKLWRKIKHKNKN